MTWSATPLIVTSGTPTNAPNGGGFIDTDITLMNQLKAQYIDFRDYSGFDPTGTNTQVTNLQAAINDACSHRLQLRIPPGEFVLDATIHLCPAMNRTQTIDIVGAGAPGPVGGYPVHATSINPFTIFHSTVTQTPAFSLTGGRGGRLKDFVITGENAVPQYLFPTDVKANYNIGGAFRDSQYSPHCALALDAFNLSAPPSDGGYPGMSSSYNAGNLASTNFSIENVCYNNFVVGFGHTLSGAGSLSDSITHRRCNWSSCDTAYAVGQTQSKICLVELGDIGSCRTAFDGLSYGAKQGVPVRVIGVNLGYLYRVFSYSQQYGPMLIDCNYAESVRSLGNYGNGTATSKGFSRVTGGSFLMYNGNGYSAPLPPILFETYGMSQIESMSFDSNGRAFAQNYAYNMVSDTDMPIVCDNINFQGPTTAQVPAFIGASSAKGSHVRLRNCQAAGQFPALPYTDDSTQDVTTIGANGRFQGSIKSSRYANGTGEVFYQSANATGTLALTVSAISLTTRSLTLTTAPASGAKTASATTNWGDPDGLYPVTFSNGNVKSTIIQNGLPSLDWIQDGLSSSATTAVTVSKVGLQFTYSGTALIVGDCLFWKMLPQGGSTTGRTVIGWLVSTISGTTVTCIPLFDVTQYDTAANNPTTSVVVAQRQWAPTVSLTCTTNSTTALTAVSPINLVLNGDWVQGAGIPANTRVVSGAGTASLTLNNAATASATGVALYFGRMYTPALTGPTW